MPRTFLIAILALAIIIPTAFLTYKFLFLKNKLPTQQTIETSSPEVTSDLKLDQSFVLSNVSESDRTEKEKVDFQTALENAAVTSEQLNITACSPTPVVLKLVSKQDFTVKNDDALAHTLVIYGSTYQIPAKGNLTVATDFGESGHIYPYACDDISVAGVIWLPK